MGDIEKLQITVPCVDEQSAIAQVLSDMDADIAAVDDRLTKARAMKQAMAQVLLTGRVRLV
ncbi:type I restriction enzyme, S subunit [Sphaerotilus natans]|nr:type I restriction enzyme, S subunit [Sphaerotilus natans]